MVEDKNKDSVGKSESVKQKAKKKKTEFEMNLSAPPLPPPTANASIGPLATTRPDVNAPGMGDIGVFGMGVDVGSLGPSGTGVPTMGGRVFGSGSVGFPSHGGGNGSPRTRIRPPWADAYPIPSTAVGTGGGAPPMGPSSSTFMTMPSGIGAPVNIPPSYPFPMDTPSPIHDRGTPSFGGANSPPAVGLGQTNLGGDAAWGAPTYFNPEGLGASKAFPSMGEGSPVNSEKWYPFDGSRKGYFLAGSGGGSGGSYQGPPAAVQTKAFAHPVGDQAPALSPFAVSKSVPASGSKASASSGSGKVSLGGAKHATPAGTSKGPITPSGEKVKSSGSTPFASGKPLPHAAGSNKGTPAAKKVSAAASKKAAAGSSSGKATPGGKGQGAVQAKSSSKKMTSYFPTAAAATAAGAGSSAHGKGITPLTGAPWNVGAGGPLGGGNRLFGPSAGAASPTTGKPSKKMRLSSPPPHGAGASPIKTPKKAASGPGSPKTPSSKISKSAPKGSSYAKQGATGGGGSRASGSSPAGGGGGGSTLDGSADVKAAAVAIVTEAVSTGPVESWDANFSDIMLKRGRGRPPKEGGKNDLKRCVGAF